MPDHTVKKFLPSLPLEKANGILHAALKAGRDANMQPLTVAVLDCGGHLVSFQREDGSGILRGDIATGKAWGSLGMGTSSRTIRDRLKERIAFQNALSNASQGRFIPVPGGVLICNQDGQVLGSVGISGDTSEKDEYCAIKAVRAVGLLPDPEEEDPNWNSSGL